MASKWRMGWVKEQHGEYGNHGNHGGKICIKGIRRGMRAAIIYYLVFASVCNVCTLYSNSNVG